jgi:hypothetical protein
MPLLLSRNSKHDLPFTKFGTQVTMGMEDIDILVCTVDGDIDRWILVNISQSQAIIHYQLF